MPQHMTIISGGQSGVDRAALDAAVARGLPYGGWCPRGRVHQVEAAASFACTLVFKLGSRQWRPAAAPGWRMAVLVPAWLAGFVLMALCGATLLRVVPVLRDVATALPL